MYKNLPNASGLIFRFAQTLTLSRTNTGESYRFFATFYDYIQYIFSMLNIFSIYLVYFARTPIFFLCPLSCAFRCTFICLFVCFFSAINPRPCLSPLSRSTIIPCPLCAPFVVHLNIPLYVCLFFFSAITPALVCEPFAH